MAWTESRANTLHIYIFIHIEEHDNIFHQFHQSTSSWYTTNQVSKYKLGWSVEDKGYGLKLRIGFRVSAVAKSRVRVRDVSGMF